MKDTDQLAAEAWKQITDYADNCEDAIGDLAGDTNCIRFIKAAIEKATEQYKSVLGAIAIGNEECGLGMKRAAQSVLGIESRAAHASVELQDKSGERGVTKSGNVDFGATHGTSVADASEQPISSSPKKPENDTGRGEAKGLGERRTHHNTCPKGERCACYLTGYSDAEYDHGHVFESLDDKLTVAEKANIQKIEAAIEKATEPAKKLCQVYFEIAAAAIGEDSVRIKRDAMIESRAARAAAREAHEHKTDHK